MCELITKVKRRNPPVVVVAELKNTKMTPQNTIKSHSLHLGNKKRKNSSSETMDYLESGIKRMRWAFTITLILSLTQGTKSEPPVGQNWDRPAGMPKIENLEVMCGAQHMEVHLNFDSPFHGMVASKGMYGHQGCVYVPPRTGRNSFVFNIYYDKCGTKPDNNGKFYENTVVVQYDEELIEAWDEAKRLRCEWFNDYEKTATKTSPMVISDLEIVELNFHGDNVDCWMEIQEGKGPWAPPLNGIVPLGSPLTMVVAVKDPTGEFDMRVKACEASDGHGGHVLPLSDPDGCILRPKLLGKFSKLKLDDGRATVLTYAHISAFKFPDMLNVHLRCTVEICRHGCPNHCSNHYTLPKQSPIRNEIPHGQHSINEPMAYESQNIPKLLSNHISEPKKESQSEESKKEEGGVKSDEKQNVSDEKGMPLPEFLQKEQEGQNLAPTQNSQGQDPRQNLPPGQNGPQNFPPRQNMGPNRPMLVRGPPRPPQFNQRPQNGPPNNRRPFPPPPPRPNNMHRGPQGNGPPRRGPNFNHRLGDGEKVDENKNNEEIASAANEEKNKKEEEARPLAESVAEELKAAPEEKKEIFPKGPRELRLRRSVSTSSESIGVQGNFRVISQADLNFALNYTNTQTKSPQTLTLRGKMRRDETVYGICLPHLGFGILFFGLGLAALVSVLIATFFAYAHLRANRHAAKEGSISSNLSNLNSLNVGPQSYVGAPMVILRKMW